jgi:hypothetical protein
MSNMQDIVRLAGLDIALPDRTNEPEQPPEEPSIEPVSNECCSDLKYALMDIIEAYSNEYNRINLPNLKSVYDEIINNLDRILGLVLKHKPDEAKTELNNLDDSVKTTLCKKDSRFSQYIECNVTESADVLSINDTLNTPEEEKKSRIQVPTKVINDIKASLRELGTDDHLPDHETKSQYEDYIKQALENLLAYLINPDESSIKLATIYLSSLDSATKVYVPASVWNYLAVSYGSASTDSIRNILKNKGGSYGAN